MTRIRKVLDIGMENINFNFERGNFIRFLEYKMPSRILRPIGFLDCYRDCANNNCQTLKGHQKRQCRKNCKIRCG